MKLMRCPVPLVDKRKDAGNLIFLDVATGRNLHEKWYNNNVSGWRRTPPVPKGGLNLH